MSNGRATRALAILAVMVAVATTMVIVVEAAGGGFTPYPGEKFLTTSECKTVGKQLLDTCIVEVTKAANWQGAWDHCVKDGSRLLELINSTYDVAYQALSFASSVDQRFLGFVRNSSDLTAKSWMHGGIAEPMQWWSQSYTPSKVGSPPYCGVILRTPSSNNSWFDGVCSAKGTYFWYEDAIAGTSTLATATSTTTTSQTSSVQRESTQVSTKKASTSSTTSTLEPMTTTSSSVGPTSIFQESSTSKTLTSTKDPSSVSSPTSTASTASSTTTTAGPTSKASSTVVQSPMTTSSSTASMSSNPALTATTEGPASSHSVSSIASTSTTSQASSSASSSSPSISSTSADDETTSTRTSVQSVRTTIGEQDEETVVTEIVTEIIDETSMSGTTVPSTSSGGEADRTPDLTTDQTAGQTTEESQSTVQSISTEGMTKPSTVQITDEATKRTTDGIASQSTVQTTEPTKRSTAQVETSSSVGTKSSRTEAEIIEEITTMIKVMETAPITPEDLAQLTTFIQRAATEVQTVQSSTGQSTAASKKTSSTAQSVSSSSTSHDGTTTATMADSPQTTISAIYCSPSFCLNRGSCTGKRTLRHCECEAQYTGPRCEFENEVNPASHLYFINRVCNHTAFVERRIGRTLPATASVSIGHYCYILMKPAPREEMEQRCKESFGGTVYQFPTPEALTALLRELGQQASLQISLGMIDLVKDPATRQSIFAIAGGLRGILPADLAQLAQRVQNMSGEGCPTLSRDRVSRQYTIQGEADCPDRPFVCRTNSWRHVGNLTHTYFNCDGEMFCSKESTVKCHRGSCVCKPGFMGKACEQPIDFCNTTNGYYPPCVYGKCDQDVDGQQCKCYGGAEGERCEVLIHMWSSEELRVFNGLKYQGCTSVTAVALFVNLLSIISFDGTPEGTMKRHALLTLTGEHIGTMLFSVPKVMGINAVQCRYVALLILYLKFANMVFTLFQCYYIYSIKTGVTYGDWGWANAKWLLMTVGYAAPLIYCIIIHSYDFDRFTADWACMLEFNVSNHSRFLVPMIFLVGFSYGFLEMSTMYSHYQEKCTSTFVDRVQLAVAKRDWYPLHLIVLFQPISYWYTAQGVYYGRQDWINMSWCINMAMAIAMFVGYFVYSPVHWIWLEKKAPWLAVGLFPWRGRDDDDDDDDRQPGPNGRKGKYAKRIQNKRGKKDQSDQSMDDEDDQQAGPSHGGTSNSQQWHLSVENRKRKQYKKNKSKKKF